MFSVRIFKKIKPMVNLNFISCYSPKEIFCEIADKEGHIVTSYRDIITSEWVDVKGQSFIKFILDEKNRVVNHICK